MDLYSDRTDETKDTYYEEQSRKAIDAAVKEAEGRPPQEVRFVIRRSYPFGPLRRGRPYKIWNRLVLEKEKELGLEPRRHHGNALKNMNDD